MGCCGTASAISRLSCVCPQTARARFALAICVCLVPLALCAQEPSEPDLRKMARNPFADIIKLPLEVDIDFDAGPYHRAAADLQVQPLIPIQISEKWLLIPRIVATAINYVPDVKNHVQVSGNYFSDVSSRGEPAIVAAKSRPVFGLTTSANGFFPVGRVFTTWFFEPSMTLMLSS